MADGPDYQIPQVARRLDFNDEQFNPPPHHPILVRQDAQIMRAENNDMDVEQFNPPSDVVRQDDDMDVEQGGSRKRKSNRRKRKTNKRKTRGGNKKRRSSSRKSRKSRK